MIDGLTWEQPKWVDDTIKGGPVVAPTEAPIGDELSVPAIVQTIDEPGQGLSGLESSSKSEAHEPDTQSAAELEVAPADPQKKKWGLKLAIGGATLAAALIAAPHAIEAKDAIVDNLAWAAPVLITSEAAWNAGAAMMLIAAGKKIGNPLKLHSRFKEVSHDFVNVVEKPLFKAGMVTNILGEVGTASILIGGSIAELPPTTWPLTIGTSVALAAPAAVAWTALWRSRHKTTSLDVSLR